MRRFSLFTIVIVLPTILAIVFAIYTNRLNERRKETLRMLERGLKSGDMLSFGRLVRDFSDREIAEQLKEIVNEPQFVFDGDKRIAQIHSEGREYKEGKLDMLYLHDLTYNAHTALHEPPIGTVIDSVVFTGNGVDVTLHGELILDESVIKIPAEAPEVYHLAWPVGSPPASPSIESLIRNRQR